MISIEKSADEKIVKKHDFDAAWKSILEAFEIEIVELLFPELYDKIHWEKGTESLDKELQEIQKEIFDKDSSQNIISDKIIKVRLKDNDSKILFIHVEVQSYNKGDGIFGERMFRYFYRIWDKFRYKYKDKSEIVAAAIYTYKGSSGKDKKYIYRCLDIPENVLVYNFRTIDVETIELGSIHEENPLKLVFKIAKELIETKSTDEEIYKAKIKLAQELTHYNKVKNSEQIKALVDFLEYLFLIQDDKIEKMYKDYKQKSGGALTMTIDEIRRLYHTQRGIEQGIEKGIAEGKKQDILELLQDVGKIPHELKGKISSQNDVEILKKWLKVAARSETIEEFIEKINK